MKLYDEAIEEAIWHGEIEGDNTVIVILKALERAKRVEELLELYKKECKMIQRYINGSYQPMGEHLDNIKQIKALEEELK